MQTCNILETQFLTGTYNLGSFKNKEMTTHNLSNLACLHSPPINMAAFWRTPNTHIKILA